VIRRLLSEKYNLLAANPTLAKEWHPTRNAALKPKDVTPGQSKRVWWICHQNHEWQMSLNDRSRGRGCPFCAGKRTCNENSLHTLNPNLAKEWHPTKNDSLTSKDITPNSNRKVWWRCSKGHEWQSTVYKRNIGRGCPYCAGQAVCEDNCLATINPVLAAEWHPTKNGDLTPNSVMPGTNKKIWWICSRKHEWKAIVNSRNQGRGCPYCHSKTSLLELRIYAEMKNLFDKVLHRERVHGVECDIYIPKFKLGIEIDGSYWHEQKYKEDKIKYNYLKRKGVVLIRIRAVGLKKVSQKDIYFLKNKINFNLFRKILIRISKEASLNSIIRNRIRKYMKKGRFENSIEYQRLTEMLPSPLPGFSLAETNKLLAAEWHPTRNGTLTPRDYFPNSHIKVWWKCSKGHDWEASIVNRNKGCGCPYCAGQAVCEDNCLTTINPVLAAEWHPTKNGDLTPNSVVPNTKKKVWWECNRRHEWMNSVANRNKGRGCPYCSGKKVSEDNSLEKRYPLLAREWHPLKNGDLTPHNVAIKSNKKVWWICGRGHEWEAPIYNRTSGSGCPYCAGHIACYDNCLQTLNPILAADWHPTKNGNLSPDDVTSFSNKKVWWTCKKRHEWEARISNRSLGAKCPFCAGKRKDLEARERRRQ
jgi:hypothetical protein